MPDTKIESLINELKEVAYHPKRQFEAFKSEGKKVVGVMPYHVPEEMVYAAGMVPMGMWGSNKKAISRAKEYCATFYCSLAQLDLEMLMDGTCDGMAAVITPTPCDTLRPMSQNIKVAVEGKMKAIFLAHPQRRSDDAGKRFTMHMYQGIKKQLEEVAGKEITDEALKDAIKVYNRFRKAQRRFIVLAGKHPEAVSAVNRSAVIKANYFMMKDLYTEKLEALNAELEALPESKWDGIKVMTSGIICDNPDLLKIFDEQKIAIVCDDIAHESRNIGTDVPEDIEDPMQALVQQWADTINDPIYWDECSRQHRRSKAMIRKARRAGAQGLVIFMMVFCDPEETDYPHVKDDFTIADIPHIRLGLDHQMRSFGQIETSLQGLVETIEAQEEQE